VKFPVIASTSAFRAWLFGVAVAVATIWLPALIPTQWSFYLFPLAIAGLTLYSLTVRPRVFAASGVLLGVAPFFAWGVIDGLQKCARFNRGGPTGGCEADPSAQLLVTALVYGAALLVTGLAAWSAAKAHA
jgi:hypothetical protein